MTVTFTASQSGRTSATVTQRRSFRAPVVTMASLGIASGFVAEMFTPSHAAAHAGSVLVFGGSEGGLAVSAITAEVTPVDPAANIPVGRTRGPVLLCGTDDALWPSCKASDIVKKELSGRPVTEVREPGAGHLVDFFVPNLPLTSTTSPDVNGNLLDVGGTVQADALGRLDAWPAVLSFLDRIPS